MASVTLGWNLIGDWTNTFNAELTIQNLDSIAYADWTVDFIAPYELTNVWDGAEIVDVVSVEGGFRYTIRGTGQDAVLPPNGSISFRFKASGEPSLPTAPLFSTPFEVSDIGWFILGDWQNSFNAEITVPNSSGVAQDNWQLTFGVPYQLKNVWGGAEIVSFTQEGGQYIYLIQGTGDESTIPANGSVTFRFKGLAADPSIPEAFTFVARSDTSFESGSGSGGGGSTSGQDLDVNWDLLGDWNSIFNAEVTLSNPNSSSVDNWQASFRTSYSLENVWGGAEIVSFIRAGDDYIYIVQGTGDESNIPANGQVTFRYKGNDDTPSPLTDFTLVDASGSGPSGGGDPVGGYGSLQLTDYQSALDLSMLFYYAQRSGDLPEDNPIAWRGDSALDDGSDVGLDLSGGWYDAGDHVKFHFPAAFTTTMLAWGGLEFKEGYEQAGTYDELKDHLTWITDYWLRTIVLDSAGNVDWIAGQVGDGNIDHAVWVAPENLNTERPTYIIDENNPGSDLSGEMAAALAAASIFFRDSGDGDYADLLLDRAQAVYSFAEAYQGTYSSSIPDAAQFYNSFSGFRDELSWGAAWLYKATDQTDYLDKAESYYQSPNLYWGWDNKTAGTAELLYQLTGKSTYRQGLSSFLNQWSNQLPRTPGTESNGGLAWLDGFGSNRYAANAAFLATVHGQTLFKQDASADDINDALGFAYDQIDYVLGVNPDNFSYVVGFSENDPLYVHHRAASGTTDVNDPNPNQYDILGGLVGGPDRNGNYNDVRSNFFQNEVALDYNAGFSGALAGMVEFIHSGNAFI